MVTDVAKAANIAQMAEKCICRISACPTPPHTNLVESGPGNTFSAQMKEKPKNSFFSTQKKGGSFFDPPPPRTPHTISLKSSSMWVSSGGVGGGSDQKLIGRCVYWTK